MTSITLTAPAKVNLFLKILKKRKDSYHDILTLFEMITLADTVTISKIPCGIEVYSDKFITADPKDNIVYKAAAMMLGHKKPVCGVRIRIKKRIPIAAGLGGGSSDAASVLIGTNKLFKLGVGRNELMRIAAKIGADVPFFVLNTPFATGRGKGEVLTKTDLRARLWHLIIYPGFRLSTEEIYKAFDDNIAVKTKGLTKRPCDAKMRFCIKPSMDFVGLESMLYNDLQGIAVAKNKIIGKVLQRLASSLGKKTVVSGSGPSVFCLYKTRREAISARDRLLACVPALERKNWQIFVAGTKI